MNHRCFISFKFEDTSSMYRIAAKLDEFEVPYNVIGENIDSDDAEYVIQRIREKYMNNTTVTIFLIGKYSSEDEGVDIKGFNHQSYIIRELRATLLDREGNPRDGLLGIVLPEMYDRIYGGTEICPHCGKLVNYVNINPSTVIKEFSENYYLSKGDCDHFGEEDRFCVLAKYNDFMKDPKKYIDMAYDKLGQPIAKKVHFRDIEHKGKI